MKKIMLFLVFFVVYATTVIATVSPALTASSGMGLAYCFLGICGLIIFFQLIPVLSVAYGIIRALFSKKEQTYEEHN